MNVSILHVTPHLGGGIGKALSGILTFEGMNNNCFKHRIIMLEEPENLQFVNICKEKNVAVSVECDFSKIAYWMKDADIIISHWWHHPLNAFFLVNYPLIDTRLIIWSHINGCSYPIIPFNLIEAVHKVFFTSEYSFFNPFWSKIERDYVKKSARVIYGLGHLDEKPLKIHANSGKFIIGYVGTLNFSKLHPDFVEFCAAVVKLVPESYFVLVGIPEAKEQIIRKAELVGISDRFEFTGYTNDIDSQLDRFDVFAYPLNPQHFGTTENALLEAMNSRLPVVALNQNCEQYLIKNNVTGFLADNIDHYAHIIKHLFDNPSERFRIGMNAQREFEEKFSMKKNVMNMYEGFSEVLQMHKRKLSFKPIFGEQPYQWLLSCLGEERDLFENSINRYIMEDKIKATEIIEQIKKIPEILKGESKSSIKHFARYFSEDNNLRFWSRFL